MPARQLRKYIFVTGGVISGIGKGVTASSMGRLLMAKGFSVTAIKIDPYVNVDAGTMNPTEHGEVFVLNDGYETDQDMGNYERFLDATLPNENYLTTGRIYQHVIERERNLEYDGKCVEVVPDVPLEVIRRIEHAAKLAGAEITIIEVGGTVGEYQNILFLEAARMMQIQSPKDVIVVMVSYLPVPSMLGEMKTKPTQYAIRTLNAAGIHPAIVVGRAPMPMDVKRKEKIARNSNMPIENIISAPDVEHIYEIPLLLEREKMGDRLLEALDLRPKNGTDLKEWEAFIRRLGEAKDVVKIAIVGKYFESGSFTLTDSYISVIEAVKFSACALGVRPKLVWIDSTDFEEKNDGVKTLEAFDGVIVPGGFGSRGVEGKVNAVNYVRTNGIPYFGLCYGMHMAIVEYARNVLGLTDAHTVETKPNTAHPVIDVMPDQREKLAQDKYGGTMRLGAYRAILKKGTVVERAYGVDEISERHRHRYEVNPEYIERLEKGGIVFSGTSPDGALMEIMELPQSVHPFFVATQFHPEFMARPLSPHPLFTGFMKAAHERSKKKS